MKKLKRILLPVLCVFMLSGCTVKQMFTPVIKLFSKYLTPDYEVDVVESVNDTLPYLDEWSSEGTLNKGQTVIKDRKEYKER